MNNSEMNLERPMPFSSQGEAKQFLAGKIVREAEREGRPLSDMEKRMLLFSEQEPETMQGLPEDSFWDVDEEYESRITGLLRAAYARDDEAVEEKCRYKDAFSKLREGDHYISVMAAPALSEKAVQVLGGSVVRDMVLYIAIGLGLVGGIVAFAFWSHPK